jgi:signal transduction histidine kinase
LFGELVGQNLFTETLADRTRTAVDVRREALAAIDRARTTGAVQTIEVRTMALDREQILEVRISPAEDELLFFVRDVTERRALESQLAISERMASVGTLAAGAAHEINNPLTYVLANLRFALEELDDGTEALRDVRESLGDALDGAERIAGIVGDLKSYSRVSEETVDGRVDLAAVVEHAKRLSQSQVRHRGARLSLRLGSAPPVRGDENRLVQVLVNLILNALHALEDGGPREVEIRLGREPGWALLEIADSGRGMTTEVQKRIFDPFFTTKGLGGTGLGLSIVHNIVSEHGGAIAVRSREGEGTTFTVRLPSMLAEDAAPHRAASEHPAAKAKRALRVLVIDDDAPVRQAVARMLIAHEVRMASAGAEGLEVVEGFDPEVILCDLMMPGMDGLEVYRRLDARGLGPRVVFMTGGLLEDEDREHVDAWGVPVLRKPFSPKELEARLAERLEAPSRCVPLAV